MAAGLGFKDFTTGEVLTAADVDGYLMQGIWVFANATARDAAVTSPQEGNACYLKDTNQVLTYSGTAWVAVGGGGGGKVLQVVFAEYSTTNTTTTTYVDTGLSASITPSAATSKILVIASQQASASRSADDVGVQYRLVRGSTTILQQGAADDGGSFYQYIAMTGESSVVFTTVTPITYLDSPSTTSATTYKITGRSNFTGTTASFQKGNAISTITLLEIGA